MLTKLKGKKQDSHRSRAEEYRDYAYDQLLRIERDGAFIERLPAGEGIRQRVREMVAGVTRWKRRLDFWIETFYRGDPNSLQIEIRVVLRMGLYEMVFMHAPQHAVLFETVGLAKSRIHKGAGSLVNAILRTVQRRLPELPESEDLAIRWSHPDWMVDRWLERFGEEDTVKLLEMNNQHPSHAIRFDSQRYTDSEFWKLLEDSGVTARKSTMLPDTFVIDRLQPLVSSGILGSGIFVQDEAAALVVHVLDPKPGETLLDACAAPGGKTFLAASRMAGKGRIIAVDRNKKRLQLLARTAKKNDYGLIETWAGDFAESPFREIDRILIDAPCTGTGVLSRKPDIRWHRTPENLDELVALQEHLLEAAASRVKDGGTLVYSTCSIEREENENQVSRFLERHPEFKIYPLGDLLPPHLITQDSYYFSLPSHSGMDGAFAARLVKKAGEDNRQVEST